MISALACLDVWLHFTDISIFRPARVAYLIETPKLILIFIYLNSFPTPNDRIISGLCIFSLFTVCFFLWFILRGNFQLVCEQM